MTVWVCYMFDAKVGTQPVSAIFDTKSKAEIWKALQPDDVYLFPVIREMEVN